MVEYWPQIRSWVYLGFGTLLLTAFLVEWCVPLRSSWLHWLQLGNYGVLAGVVFCLWWLDPTRGQGATQDHGGPE